MLDKAGIYTVYILGKHTVRTHYRVVQILFYVKRNQKEKHQSVNVCAVHVQIHVHIIIHVVRVDVGRTVTDN